MINVESRNFKSNILILIVLASFLTIFIRFYFLQINQNRKHNLKAGSNSIRKISLYAPRGIIYDRYNEPIVDNKPIYDLSIIPFDATDEFDYNGLSKIINFDSIKLKNQFLRLKESFYRFKPKVVKSHIDFETRSIIEESKLRYPGLIFSEFPARTYPSSARMTHVLGYLRIANDEILKESKNTNYQLGDVFGYSGIEKMYESTLRGKDGIEYHLVDIYGIDHGIYSDFDPKQPIAGLPIFLTIDNELQGIIESELSNKVGAVICMNPNTGEVLAYASSPDYNLNSFTGPVPIDLWQEWKKDKKRPLLNRGIQGLYPPGSTFKIIASAIGIEGNYVHPDWEVSCNGAYVFGDRTFHCWNEQGHGKVNLNSAMKYSCNIYFYHLIQKIPFDKWYEICREFGFGSSTGIDLFNEKSGSVPNKLYMDNKYTTQGWAMGNLLNFVIGQGDILVTPIQILHMVNLVSTKGNTFSPHLNKNIKRKEVKLSLKKETWEILNNAMKDVVNSEDGTGKTAFIRNHDVHGKTGTAENPHGDDHSWFVGYLVKDNKLLVSTVVIIENGGKGSGIAADIAKTVFSYISKLK